jgi:hypothetical protein
MLSAEATSPHPTGVLAPSGFWAETAFGGGRKQGFLEDIDIVLVDPTASCGPSYSPRFSRRTGLALEAIESLVWRPDNVYYRELKYDTRF